MTNNGLESRKDVLRRELDERIQQAESHMKKLEELEDTDPNNLELGLALATTYADISVLYSSKSSLSDNPEVVSDSITESKNYLDDSISQIGNFIDFRNYAKEKGEILEMMKEKISGLEQKFLEFESGVKVAKSVLTGVSTQKGLEEELSRDVVKLNDEQAYMLAAAISNSAKIAESDDNYGCGFNRNSDRKETVIVNRLRREEYIGLVKTEMENVSDFIEKANGNPVNEILARVHLEKLQQLMDYANSCPVNTLFKIKGGIKVELEVGSDLDRKYWMFVDHIIRDGRIGRVSPSIKSEFTEMRDYLITSSPTLCLNSDIYQQIKKEFPFIGLLDDPKRFQELLDVASGKNSTDKIYALLTGKESRGTVGRLDYLMQRIGGAVGLPNQFIDEK